MWWWRLFLTLGLTLVNRRHRPNVVLMVVRNLDFVPTLKQNWVNASILGCKNTVNPYCGNSQTVSQLLTELWVAVLRVISHVGESHLIVQSFSKYNTWDGTTDGRLPSLYRTSLLFPPSNLLKHEHFDCLFTGYKELKTHKMVDLAIYTGNWNTFSDIMMGAA